MMIITCYRVESDFRSADATITLTKPSSDKIYTEMKLVLPAGYELADSVSGLPVVYDRQGDPCELCSSKRGATVLAISANRSVSMRHAPEGKKVVPLQEARLAAGLTQQELADASGVNVRQIQRVELGESEAGNLTARNLLAIADALGVEIRNLI